MLNMIKIFRFSPGGWHIAAPGQSAIGFIVPEIIVLILSFICRTVLIALITFLIAEIEQGDQADHRNDGNYLEPAAFAGIVQTPGDDAQSGAKDCQCPNSREIYAEG